MAHGAVLRSPLAHARIVAIDASAALQHPKVQAVMATDKVRFQGQEVAFVIAEDRYSARDALELIEVEYEPLPVLVGIYTNKAPGGVAYACSFRIAEAVYLIERLVDCLRRWAPVGVRHVEMPCTPGRVWEAMQGDQPGVTAETVRALLSGWGGGGAGSGALLAACSYEDGRGHPLAFGRGRFGELADLHGDKGVWKLLDRHADSVLDVPVPGQSVDTWDEYQAVLSQTGLAAS